jgi:hypothetical protein
MSKTIRIFAIILSALVLFKGVLQAQESSANSQAISKIQLEVAHFKHITDVLKKAAAKKSQEAAALEGQAQQLLGQAEAQSAEEISGAQQQAAAAQSSAQSNAGMLSLGSGLAQAFGAPQWLTSGLQGAANSQAQAAQSAGAAIPGAEAQAQQAVYEAQKQALPLQAKADVLKDEAKRLSAAAAAIDTLADSRLMLALAYDLHDKINQDTVAVNRLQAELDRSLK